MDITQRIIGGVQPGASTLNVLLHTDWPATIIMVTALVAAVVWVIHRE